MFTISFVAAAFRLSILRFSPLSSLCFPAPLPSISHRISFSASRVSLRLKLPNMSLEELQPPIASQLPHTVEDPHTSEKYIDEYHWIRNRSDPKVLKYIEQENQYTDQVYQLTSAEKLRKKIFYEMKSRMKETDASVPFKHGDFYYFRRTLEGLEYPVYYRCSDLQGMRNVQQIIDGNQLSEGLSYFSLDIYEISPDNKKLAYGIDTSGDEKYSVFVKDLTQIDHCSDIQDEMVLSDVYECMWSRTDPSSDFDLLYYLTLDETLRPHRVWRHRIHSRNTEDDELIFEESDERFHLSLESSQDGRFCFIKSESQITTEVLVLSLDHILPLSILKRREQGVKLDVEIYDNVVYLLSNQDDCKNFKLLQSSLDHDAFILHPEQAVRHLTDPSAWKVVIEHSVNVELSSLKAIKNHLIISMRENGVPQIMICNIEKDPTNPLLETHRLSFPEDAYDVTLENNVEFDIDYFVLNYSSLKTPNSIFHYHLSRRELELIKQKEVLGRFDPSNYIVERVFADAEDGIKVPISLIRRKDIQLNGKAPCFLYGYGSYGISIDPYFNDKIFSLVDRGFIYAIAHIRGGGEMGRYWYEEGKLNRKKTTFTDFVSCARFLCAENYTQHDRIAAYGASAGGLLIGAVLTMTGDSIFKVAVADVPFVDCVNTLLDKTIPLTVIEWEEWGNPFIKEEYEYIKSYSPYDNLTARSYPDTLIIAGLNDPRVQYFEPTKFCARMRRLKTDHNMLLLKVNTSGHFGASGRYEALKEDAFAYAFVVDRLSAFINISKEMN